MPYIRSILCLLLALTLCACSSAQQRGLSGNAYVSTSRPAIQISAKDMPVVTAGRGTGLLYDPSMVGPLSVRIQSVLYASGADRPMAAITHAELSNERWIWSTIHPRLGAINEGVEVLGGQAFTAFTYLIPIATDPYGGAAGEEPEEGARYYWLARYFAARVNFNRGKIILEYREPVPAGFGGSLANIPFGMIETVRAFEQRAREAFELSAPGGAGEVRNGYPEGVRWNYMRDLYLGDVMENDIRDSSRF